MFDPFLLLLAAVILMIGGVLWLRIHPFIALLSAALLVEVATPMPVRLSQAVRARSVRVARIVDAGLMLEERAEAGDYVVFRRAGGGWLEAAGTIRLAARSASDRRAPRAFRPVDAAAVQANDRLIAAGELERVRQRLREETPGERLAAGLAGAFRDIGLPVAMAAIIGASLMQSGAALRIVLFLQRLLGMDRTAPALVASGFFLGIPVFFDTVFYLLLPLVKTLYAQTRRNYVLYVLAIVVGATMAHSLVPPTPGPLYVAAQLDVKIGTMINAGLLLGIMTASTGYLYARWANRRWQWQPAAGDGALEAPVQQPATDQLPPLSLSVLPILLPLVLLGGHSMLQGHFERAGAADSSLAYGLWQWSGDKHLVLMLAAALSLMLLAGSKRAAGESSRKLVGRSLADAGVIILITCAGGAFGAALRESGMAASIENRFPATLTGVGLLTLAFGITALVRMAQGSATVAMITSVGIIAPLLEATSLPYHPVYLALAIGCGSKPFSWMNDSGFWVVSSMSGLDEGQTLKTFSAALTLMGLVGFALTVAAALVWPLVPT